MGKIIACVDGSKYIDGICDLSSWMSKSIGAKVSLLHVAVPHCDVTSKGDLSGSIGVGVRGDLLEGLTQIDEAHGKEEQKKGQSILDKASVKLAANDIDEVEHLHRRGSVVQTISDLEPEAEMIVMGRNGEDSSVDSGKIGSNVEDVVRSISKPILVTTKSPKKIERFLIAYDGSASTKKAVEYIVDSEAFKGLECHILKVGDDEESVKILQEAVEKLQNAGFDVKSSLKQGRHVGDVISDYVKEKKIDLLAIGAYGHSKIRSLILGSSTTDLINKSVVPLLLFR